MATLTDTCAPNWTNMQKCTRWTCKRVKTNQQKRSACNCCIAGTTTHNSDVHLTVETGEYAATVNVGIVDAKRRSGVGGNLCCGHNFAIL